MLSCSSDASAHTANDRPPRLPAREELADALWNACEAAQAVERKPQLFLWMQTHLRRFVPHELAVCAIARPGYQRLAPHVFHGVPLPAPALAALADGEGRLLRALLARWQQQPHARPVSVQLAAAADPGTEEPLAQLRGQGFATLLVQAVPSAREAHAVDALFVFGLRERVHEAEETSRLALLLPQLHLMSLRVGASEEARAAPRSRTPSAAGTLTLRERQILMQAREGKRNAEIGEALGISALTVKNHLQNILRKLGASNRAQAVAEALSRHLLSGTPVPKRRGQG